MTTMTVHSPAVLPVRPVTRLRLTARGRRVLLGIAAIPLAVGIVLTALSGGSAAASGDAVETVAFDTVIVLPGDTLWSIAESIAPEADPREVIGEIARLNLLESRGIQVGQELAIPSQYAQ